MHQKRNFLSLHQKKNTYRKKNTNRKKNTSQITNFITIPSPQFKRQYSTQAHKSIHKDFQVSRKRPVSSHKKVKQTYSQSSHKINVPQITIQDFQKRSIHQKMNTIIHNIKSQRRKYPKRFKYNKQENQQKSMIEDFTQQLKIDRKIKRQIINDFNQKIIQCFPNQVDFQEQTFRNKKRILRFKKQQKVLCSYKSDQLELLNRKQKVQQLQRNIQKKNYGIYSKSTKKIYSYLPQKKIIENIKVKGKAGKYEKLFYDNYLCSYSQRKNVLKSLFD